MKYAIDITDTAKGHLWDIAIYIAEQSGKRKQPRDSLENWKQNAIRLENFRIAVRILMTDYW